MMQREASAKVTQQSLCCAPYRVLLVVESRLGFLSEEDLEGLLELQESRRIDVFGTKKVFKLPHLNLITDVLF